LFASDEKLVASDENNENLVPKNRDPTKFTHHFLTIRLSQHPYKTNL
jgi:hypothetical protein